MDEPIDAFAGWVLLGFGTLLGYATWKKVPGGAIGLIKQAVTTGKIGTSSGPSQATLDEISKETVTHQGPLWHDPTKEPIPIHGLPGAPLGPGQ